MAAECHTNKLSTKLNRDMRTMPKWVNETNNRVGPKPPPPPTNNDVSARAKAPALPPKTSQTPEPDYEVIEFSGQQYSNEIMKPSSAMRPKTPDTKLKCTLCGSSNPFVSCAECSQQIFCVSCDDMFHKHPKRKNHIRKAIEESRPPLPPKVMPGKSNIAAPIAPPRRSKRGLLTPLLQRKEQVNNFSPTSTTNGGTTQREVAVAAANGISAATIKAPTSFLHRPLPDTPKTPTPSEATSSRSDTPKSVFDAIQRPPSVTLEKIKSKANATLDRMALLQQRYRQQKDQLSDDKRSKSVAHDQRRVSQQHPPHNHQQQLHQQPIGARNMSTSVMNLNQINKRAPPSRSYWQTQQMQQSQSMAQLNCNCVHCAHWTKQRHQQHHNAQMGAYQHGWCQQQELNRSNLSLNVAPQHIMPAAHSNSGMYPPPVFMTQHGLMGQMYPHTQPYPMEMVMRPGLKGMPPTARARTSSRPGSRLPSPALSRKSVTLRRKRASYTEDEPTDDEDSDQDDRRSITSNRSAVNRTRDRRFSSSSHLMDDESEMGTSRNKGREHRRASVAKSLQNDWLPGRRMSTNSARSTDASIGTPNKSYRIYSDLDSDGSGTRALVQAKIQQKLEENSKQGKKTAAQKITSETQTIGVKNIQPQTVVGPKEIEVQLQVEAEITQSTEPAEIQTENNTVEMEDDGTSLGPPPSTPDYEWECEFCTFVNEPQVKICLICCKTPSKPPVQAGTLKSAAANTTKTDKTENAKTSTTKDIATERITNGLSKVQLKDTATVNRNDSQLSASKKESLEDIWAALDENIQTTADKVIRNAQSKKTQKVSTASGGTNIPYQQIESTKKQAPVERRIMNETGTSPPPQSISTQTYETLEVKKAEPTSRLDKTRKFAQSQESVQSYDYKPLENEMLANLERNLYNYNDTSRRENDITRQRSIHDLHHFAEVEYSPLTSTPGRRQSLMRDLLNLQKAHTQTYSPIRSIASGSPTPLYDGKSIGDPETELYILMKEAELYKYSVDEVLAALKYCGNEMHPIQWLRENWAKLIQTVQSLATKYGQERAENIIGTISQTEARDALRLHGGNLWQAVSECIEQRQHKFREISKENFLREDIVSALTAHQGNMELALMDLRKSQLKPFLMHIWGSPAGVENESGANLLPTSSPSTPLSGFSNNTKNSDIHDFVNMHAPECFQTPNAAGAFSNTSLSLLSDTTSELRNYTSEAMSNYNSSYNLDSTDLDESASNKNVLKDLESLIGNIEQNQVKQNEKVLRSIESMLDNFVGRKETEQVEHLESDSEPDGLRLLMKSPITSGRTKLASNEESDKTTSDIKNFIWQHIQEIVPNLVQQVEMELVERDSSDNKTEQTSNPSLLEPTAPLKARIPISETKWASFREEVPTDFYQTTEMNSFQMEMDNVIETMTEDIDMLSFTDVPKQVYKSYIAPKHVEQQITDTKENITEVQNDAKTSKTSQATAFTSSNQNTDILTPQGHQKRTHLPKNINKEKQRQKFEKNENIDLENQETSNTSTANQTTIALNTVIEPENTQENKSSIQKIETTTTLQSETPSDNTVIVASISRNSIKKSRIPVRRKISTNSIDIYHNETATPDTISTAVAIELTEVPRIEATNDEYELVSKSPESDEQTQSVEYADELSLYNGDSESNDFSDLASNEIIDDSQTSDEELYSADSGESVAEEDAAKSLSSVSEMLLLLPTNEETLANETNEVQLSPSTDTILSLSSQDSSSSTIKNGISKESIRSNLSEMVADTHRLIKQMKDEITLDEFESSSEEDYTDDTDEFIEDGEEYDEEIGEEEEDEDDDDMSQYSGEEGSDFEAEDDTQKNVDDNSNDENDNIPVDNISDNESTSSSNNNINTSGTNSNNTSNYISITQKSLNSIPTSISPILEQNVSDSNLSSTTSDVEMHTGLEEQINRGDDEIVDSTLDTANQGKSNSVANNDPVYANLEDIANEIKILQEQPISVGNTIDQNENVMNEVDEETILLNENIEEETTPVNEDIETVPGKEAVINSQTAIELTLDHKDVTTSNILNSSGKIEKDTGVKSDSNDNLSSKVVIKSTSYFRSPDNLNPINEEPSSSKVQNNIIDAMKKTDYNKELLTQTGEKIISPSEQVQDINSRIENVNVDSRDSTVESIQPIDMKTNTNRSASKIPKPKEKSIKKIPLRSKSFSGPSIPIGISSVKAIQQQYLNKQTQLAAVNTSAKITPPTVIRKKSITEAITRLTKPSTSKAAEKSLPASLFRSSTQPRIPKKKYHETCFSDDDYNTTSEEEEVEPLEVRERKRSMPVFRAYPNVQAPETINPELLAAKLVDESLVSNLAEAQIAAVLVNMNFQQDMAIWAAKECSDLDQALALLQQECKLCMCTYAMNEIVSMLKCTHKCCKQCAKSYFTVQITDRSINDCNCPFCKLPELHDNTKHEDENLEYFSNLDIFLKNILDSEVHELFQRKLRDRTLLQDPNFKWCIQCSSGFFARPKQKRLICPDCGSVTCSQCRKPWEKQHEGISCDAYLEWRIANDPELQAQGVHEHLEQHGIDCPKCKFRYSLARGGCMHFTCTQCKFEFCYGCARPFMMGAKCNISPYCAKLGLHAHHPRNCLFYLRDKLPIQLQFLLKENGVTFDVDPIETNKDKSEKTANLCPIPLQKETPGGLVDTVCNNEVPDKHAGMCRTHYVEYLTAKVAKANIDPLPIFDLTDCIQELRRRGISLPERGPWDTDEIYKNMCAEVIRQHIPMQSN